MEILLDQKPNLIKLLASSALQRGSSEARGLPQVSYQLRNQRIDLRHLKRYREVIGGSAEQDSLPALYPQVLSFPLQLKMMLEKSFPFKLMGLVHLSNSFTQLRPVPTDAPYTLNCRFGEMLQHDKGAAFSLVTELLVGGVCHWSGQAYYLCRTQIDNYQFGGDYLPVETILQSTEMKLVDSIVVQSGLGRRYGMVAGDMNPIHLSGLSAKVFGFKRPLIHGMWSIARVADSLSLDGERCEMNVQFVKPLEMPSQADLYCGLKGENKYFELRGCGKGADKLFLRGCVQNIDV